MRICDLFLPAVVVVVGLTRATAAHTSEPEIWTQIGRDAMGDCPDSSLADVGQLYYRYERAKDELWFRLALYGMPNEQALGINIIFDTGKDDAAKTSWWGSNKDFQFDRLLTAWVTRTTAGYQGTIGISDAAGVKAKNFTNLPKNDVQIRTADDSIVIGVKRTDVTNEMKLNLIAAVGSNERWNDDIPNTGSATIDLNSPRPTRGLREVDTSRNNLCSPPSYRTLPVKRPPKIARRGSGDEALILIPGVYSGNAVFDGFIARNHKKYRFYVVTPPGLCGAPARPMPTDNATYGMQWTQALQRDILELIRREKLNKPVLVAHGFPGSIVGEALAIQHPEAVGGLVDVAAMPTRPSPNLRDPTSKTPTTIADRAVYVDVLVRKWFKYVTPETWLSNNYPTEMYSSDPARAEKAKQQSESAPLEVKIRYLCESISWDPTGDYDKLTVPILALVPGFDETFLADQTNNGYKTIFQDAWQALSKYPEVHLVTVQGARALILDDQPQVADDAIVSFINARHQLAWRSGVVVHRI